MKIGIVGCGTAGPAAGTFLARAGHDVTLFERAAVLGPIGAGLLLQPTGMAVLRRLGLAELVGVLASPIARLVGHNRAGRLVLDTRYADLAPDMQGWGVHRAALSEALLNAAMGAGVRIHTGVTAAGWNDLPDGRVVLLCVGGVEHGPFDLLIAADGGKSRLRAGLPGVRRARAYPWGALWVVADDSDGFFGDELRQVYRGTREMIGFLPSGRPRGGAPRTVSMFWSVRMDEVDRVRAQGLDAWKARVRNLTKRADPILEQVASFEQLIVAGYTDVVLETSYSGSVVLLGDAAHAMSPQLGQGANLALLDAAALADAFAEAGTIVEGLDAYDRARRSNVRFYQRVSRWLTPLFQSRAGVLAWPRDRLMLPLSRISRIRKFMGETLIGVRTGFLPGQRMPDAAWREERAPELPAGIG